MAGILIVRQSAIGDIVHALPLARALRSSFPDDFLFWAVERPFADFVRATESVDEVIEVDTKAWRGAWLSPATWSELRELGRRLSSLHLDWAVDAQGLLKSAMLVRVSGAQRKVRLPRVYLRERPAALLVREEAPVPAAARHVVEVNLALARYIGADVSRPTFGRLFTEHDAAWADGAWAGMELPGARVVMLWPGANWVTKRWPAERFVELGRRLSAAAGVIVGWGPAEKDVAADIAGGIADAVLVPETGITQLAALISHCDLFVGGDTGPLHIAAATGVPTLGIYGPTSPERNGPYGNRSRVLRRPCEPDGPACHRRVCRRWECIPAVSVDEAAEGALALLEETA